MAALMSKSLDSLNKALKPIHPLFARPAKQSSLTVNLQDATPHGDTVNEPVIMEAMLPKPKSGRPRRIAVENGTGYTAETDIRPLADLIQNSQTSSQSTAELLDVDLNHGRRKRQKTASPGSETFSFSGSLHTLHGKNAKLTDVEASSTTTVTNNLGGNGVPALVGTQSLGQHADDVHPNHSGTAPAKKPKKTLVFNAKSGTLGSPPHKVETTAKVITKSHAKQSLKRHKSMIVTIEYSNTVEDRFRMGEKIESILDGMRTATSFKQPALALTPPKTLKSTKVIHNGAAVTHSFFLPKLAVPATQHAIVDSPNVKHASVVVPATRTGTIKSKPISMPGVERPLSRVPSVERSESKDHNVRQGTPTKKVPTMPKNDAPKMFPGLGNFAKVPKAPYVFRSVWPCNGMVHVRGLDRHDVDTEISLINATKQNKKLKFQATEVRAEENLVGSLASKLSVAEVARSVQRIDLDEYPPVPSCLRAATRHFMGGPSIQKRISQELSVTLPTPNSFQASESEDDEIVDHQRKPTTPSPKVPSLYNSIAKSLSAFDESRYETQLWTQKYAPISADEVLHNVPEALLLREWLRTFTLTSSGITSGDDTAGKRAQVAKKEPPSKRKKKSKKLEDFVVLTDEDELAALQESTPASQGILRTIVSAGKDDSGKFANGVLISGPHGSGKTAAVYAVARELGFEVFEINSASRRSGKDILDRVGDVTRNHLVRPNSKIQPDPADADAQRLTDAVDSDLKNGRQGTMNSFFKTTTHPKIEKPPKPKLSLPQQSEPPKTNDQPKGIVPAKNCPKAQKQSLILFEEVDILYEEDKNFWNTVMAMIVKSKRPIIMTCSDESVVPTHTISLHAILRFTVPPTNIAADHMLLVAANEGHLIQQDAVKALYECRNGDLRGALTDLNLWCQFGVGDNRGAIDWICTRYPLGIDVDADGYKLRVISEGSYQTGMGWMCRDFLAGEASQLDAETEMLRETQQGWRLDAGDWHECVDLAGWAAKSALSVSCSDDNLAKLTMYTDFAEAMSADDFCFGTAFGPEYRRAMDSSIPRISSKAREDYPLGRQLLEVGTLEGYANDAIRVEMSLWTKSRSRHHFQVTQHTQRGYDIPTQLNPPSEASLHNLIRNRPSKTETAITRRDLSAAFDPISEPDTPAITSSLIMSSFDRPMNILVTDLAPYVRSIVSYDMRLQQDRRQMNNLISEGGKKDKRMRTTRAALSALEGSVRTSIRKDRYFGWELNPQYVLKTGLQSWLDAVVQSEVLGDDDQEMI
ncbi:hypothetical protein BJ878DRAFT_107931 [Calycina marina]|uniref:ATPase AAA-type core domain-containing protein n=1 Tax=Calycina marina TaxID=1763456 RepID=A0A9P7Z2H7_9HELO|nr:hypothetical protein BJ878DRAFT_107931 [Calycina marina]